MNFPPSVYRKSIINVLLPLLILSCSSGPQNPQSNSWVFLFYVILLKFLPGITDISFMSASGFATVNADGIYEIPFLDRMGIVFLACIAGMFIISFIDQKRGVKANELIVDNNSFKVHPAFAIGSLIILGILAALYTIYF